MIINVGLASSLGIAADKITAQIGDSETLVPSVISPIEKLLSPTHQIVAATGIQALTSFVTAFEKLRAASTGATSDVIVTLTRGLWTINWQLITKTQITAFQAGTALVQFLIQMESNTQLIGAAYRDGGSIMCGGQFRVLLKENADLRLDVGVTAAGDAVNTVATLQAEKNI